MWLHVYDSSVNVNDVHVCEEVHWARSAGNSAIENVCIVITFICPDVTVMVDLVLQTNDLSTNAFF